MAALLGWILPGAGHVYAGHAARGAIAFVAVMGVFAAGYALVRDRIFGFSAPMDLLPIPFVPYHTIPEIGNLAGAVFADLMLGPRDFDTERLLRLPRDLEHVGLTLTACSGVL